MKKIILSMLGVFMLTSVVFAQNIPEKELPHVIADNFKKSYPKASSLEWEKEGNLYKAEFEVGWLNDHTAWYTEAGERVKFSEEIAKKQLPENILAKIKTDFKGYRVDNVRKITTGKAVTYDVDLNSLKQDWDVVFDSEAKVISKIED